MTAEQRENRMKQRLDDSTAEERGQRYQFFQDMKQRRAERGLPPLRGWGGR
jgi:hypothetical protein